MQIIDKQFVRGNDNSVIYVPKNIENDFVIFENGAKCKLETFFKEFNEFGTVNENSTHSNISSNDVVDADSFFNKPIANDGLLNQLENVIKNPGMSNSGSSRFRESVEAGTGKNVKDLSEVKPVNGPIQLKENPAEMIKKSGLENRLTDNQPENINQTPIQQTTPIAETTQSAVQTNRLPEWDMFDRVKKSETVTISIPIKIQLPKAQRIEALNDMFETSFISYIAKQYIQNELSGKSKSLQMTIQNEIENWMNEQLYSDKPSKKKISETRKRTVKVKEEKSVAQAGDLNVNELYKGNPPVEWSGNISELTEINSPEQLQAVENRINKMKENGDDDKPEFIRYADMIVDYNLRKGN